MIKQSWLTRLILLGAMAAATTFASTAVAAPPAGEGARVVAVITAMYAALQADDLAGYRSIVTPDFYAFDQGRRYDGDALAKEIKSLHAHGYVFKWSVTQPDVHVIGNVAWVTYINRGSISSKSGKRRIIWQDSSVLEFQNGHWRVLFLHSSPARSAA